MRAQFSPPASFNDLAAQQLVTRTHGGVVANAIAYDLPARYKAARPDPPASASPTRRHS